MSPVESSPSWIAIALLLVAGAYALALGWVRRLARMPLPFASAVALAALVSFETLLLNALSPMGAVTRGGVAIGHAVALLAGATLARTLPRRVRVRARVPRPGWPLALALPLAAIALASALRYAPNGGDSMTYHLARVAHWIQRGSVDSYPTASLRQTVMMPGAEYVLLALQVVSGTDRLGALVQFGAYLTVVFAASPLARLAGAPASLARWAGPIAAALPMAILQASSTQNDLVAAAAAVAVLATALPMLHARLHSPRAPARALLLAVACAAAALVKASAVLAVSPILALAAARAFASIRRTGAARWLRVWAPAALAAAVLVAPDLARRTSPGRGGLPAAFPWNDYVYPAGSEWADRAANAVRGALHHLPAPAGLPAALAPRLSTRSGAILDGVPQLVPHEDVAGNPLHAAAVLAAALVAAWRFRRIAPRGRWAMGSLAAAWVLFHATLRDNEYLSRLQTPLFALAPVFLAALPPPRPPRRHSAQAVALALTGSAVLLAVLVGASSRLRPPFAARRDPPSADYYRTNPLVRDPQRTALRVAREAGCRQLGLFMGESGYDYPLTWQAMQEGVEVRHAFGRAEWPCVVYAEPSSFGFWNLPREPVALDPAEWLPAAANAGGVFLFRRRERAGAAAPAAGAGPQRHAAHPP